MDTTQKEKLKNEVDTINQEGKSINELCKIEGN